jgi:hypothetical protein
MPEITLAIHCLFLRFYLPRFHACLSALFTLGVLLLLYAGGSCLYEQRQAVRDVSMPLSHLLGRRRRLRAHGMHSRFIGVADGVRGWAEQRLVVAVGRLYWLHIDQGYLVISACM